MSELPPLSSQACQSSLPPFLQRKPNSFSSPCFKLAISLHPVLRDVRRLPRHFPRKDGCPQHPFKIVGFPHQKNPIIMSCQFNSCQVLSNRLQSHQRSFPRCSFQRVHIVPRMTLISSNPAPSLEITALTM